MASDRRKVIDIKVIGAGFGRTGTLSLKEALNDLGFGPCYHMTEVFEHPEHVAVWNAAMEGKPVDWRELLKDYQSTTDWPGCTFYEQLMEVYPDAKVLLTVRDPEKWYESSHATIYNVAKIATSPSLPILALLNPMFKRRAQGVRMVNNIIWQGTFHNNFEDKDDAIAIFKRHIEEVRRRVPAEKLLVFDVKEGWGPLCTFLGVEVPDKPFPRLNDRDAFMSRPRQMMVRGLRIGITRLAGVSLVVAAIIFLLARRKR